MISKDNLETYKFVKANTDMFDDIQEQYGKHRDPRNKQYTMLNYKRILADICDYLEGYMEYNDSKTDKYSNKVIGATAKFYDSIFREKRYRMVMVLPDFVDISEDFLEGTKELQELLLNMNKYDNELQSIQIMTNNQYRRIAKVFKDDCKLWRWQMGVTGEPDTTLRQHFKDKSTPVMHEK